jgi:hypothetical protein
VLIPVALIGPVIAGVVIQMLVGGALRETAAYEAGVLLIFPLVLLVFTGAISLQASSGKPRVVVFLTAAGASLFWWLVKVVGSIAP